MQGISMRLILHSLMIWPRNKIENNPMETANDSMGLHIEFNVAYQMASFSGCHFHSQLNIVEFYT